MKDTGWPIAQKPLVLKGLQVLKATSVQPLCNRRNQSAALISRDTHTLAEICKCSVQKLDSVFVPLLLKIVVIDPHGDTEVFVPEKMLHRSWIHTGADAARREGVPQKMRMPPGKA